MSIPGNPAKTPPQPPTERNDDTRAALDQIAQRIEAEIAARAGGRSAADQTGTPATDTSSAVGHRQLARLAHELRTPLGAIAAMAEVMRDERFGPIGDGRYADYARSIADSARHLIAVADAMLDRDAVNGGREPMTFVELDLVELAAAALAGLEPIAGAVGVGLTLRGDAGLPRVIADRRSVRQILVNVIGNALKFAPGGSEVSVTARRGDQGTVRIDVEDAGPGMAVAGGGLPEAVTAGGHGIGLPLSQTLATANGARIVISAPTGGGTRVSLEFAAARAVPV